MTPTDRLAVDIVARTLFIRHHLNREDSSEEWATRYWDENAGRPHMGDCPHALHSGPVTCDRCVCDEWRVDAEAALSAAGFLS